MIVSAASRMSSAISLGVFCRLAPSTSAIMRSRKVSPGLAVMRTIEPVGKHARAAGDAAAVAAALADDRGAFAGDGAFIDRGDAFDHFAVAGNQVAGFDQHDIVLCAESATPTLRLTGASRLRLVQLLGGAHRGGLAQRVGLGLAAAFGHRLGEVGEEHREPQPGRDAEDEPPAIRPAADAAHECHSTVVSMLPTKTVNITGLRTWRRGSSFENAVDDRPPHDRRIEQRSSFGCAVMSC